MFCGVYILFSTINSIFHPLLLADLPLLNNIERAFESLMLAEKLIILTKVSARCICLVSIHNFGNVDIFRNHSYNFEETNNASFLLNRWLFATYILDILHITFKLRISIGRFCCINITWTALTFYEKAMGSKVFTLDLHLC